MPPRFLRVSTKYHIKQKEKLLRIDRGKLWLNQGAVDTYPAISAGAVVYYDAFTHSIGVTAGVGTKGQPTEGYVSMKPVKDGVTGFVPKLARKRIRPQTVHLKFDGRYGMLHGRLGSSN